MRVRRMDERYLDMAEALASQERAEAIAAAQRQVQTHGQEECEDCGELIPPDRRAAAPFAVRCLACQSGIELYRRAFRSHFCRLK